LHSRRDVCLVVLTHDETMISSALYWIHLRTSNAIVIVVVEQWLETEGFAAFQLHADLSPFSCRISAVRSRT
jgi:hypothetical protein